MPWHLVEISEDRADDEWNRKTHGAAPTGMSSAESFIATLANEVMKSRAGDDHDIRVYRRSDAKTVRLWLSPAAAASAPQLLALFGSTPCAQEPELAGFEKVQFPFKLG